MMQRAPLKPAAAHIQWRVLTNRSGSSGPCRASSTAVGHAPGLKISPVQRVPLPPAGDTFSAKGAPPDDKKSGGNADLPPLEARVGVKDNSAFEQHSTVAFWRNYAWPPRSVDPQTLEGVASSTRLLMARVRDAAMANNREMAAYWAYHVARTTIMNGSMASVQLLGSLGASISKGKVSTYAGQMDSKRLMQASLIGLPGEAIGAFEQDCELVRAGHFKQPWDMSLRHRQFNPLFVVDQIARSIKAGGEVLAARQHGDAARGRLPYARSELYPDYYQNNFHFQTDGWFSSDSAKVYETLTESLFVGRQDAMQRMGLVPLARAARGKEGGAGMKMLEIGAGTGRFATFVRDNYPAADLTVSDLSPYYLEEARNSMAHWADVTRTRATGRTQFLQCAAESLPVEDASQDVVYSVYMFHEMPDKARDAALREMERVLKPGGTLILVDSAQLGDRPALDQGMGHFEKLNEPHYPSYLKYNFADKMQDVGLQPGMKMLQSASKMVSASKPL